MLDFIVMLTLIIALGVMFTFPWMARSEYYVIDYGYGDTIILVQRFFFFGFRWVKKWKYSNGGWFFMHKLGAPEAVTEARRKWLNRMVRQWREVK